MNLLVQQGPSSSIPSAPSSRDHYRTDTGTCFRHTTAPSPAKRHLCFLTLPTVWKFSPHFSKACKSRGAALLSARCQKIPNTATNFRGLWQTHRSPWLRWLRSDYAEQLPTEQRRLHNCGNTAACINNAGIPESLLAKNCMLSIFTVIPKRLRKVLV